MFGPQGPRDLNIFLGAFHLRLIMRLRKAPLWEAQELYVWSTGSKGSEQSLRHVILGAKNVLTEGSLVGGVRAVSLVHRVQGI